MQILIDEVEIAGARQNVSREEEGVNDSLS